MRIICGNLKELSGTRKTRSLVVEDTVPPMFSGVKRGSCPRRLRRQRERCSKGWSDESEGLSAADEWTVRLRRCKDVVGRDGDRFSLLGKTEIRLLMLFEIWCSRADAEISSFTIDFTLLMQDTPVGLHFSGK